MSSLHLGELDLESLTRRAKLDIEIQFKLDLDVQFQASSGITENQEPHLIFKRYQGPIPNGTRGQLQVRPGVNFKSYQGSTSNATRGQLQTAPGVNFKRYQGSTSNATGGQLQVVPGVNFKSDQGSTSNATRGQVRPGVKRYQGSTSNGTRGVSFSRSAGREVRGPQWSIAGMPSSRRQSLVEPAHCT
jgi:hypothetical protein